MPRDQVIPARPSPRAVKIGTPSCVQAQGCSEESGIFAQLPGLIAKIWLRDSAANEYGAVYLWADEKAYDAYVSGEVFRSIQDDPTLAGVTSRDFDVFDDLTGSTQPGLTIA